MGTDQFKLLIDTLNAAGSGAKEIAILWVVVCLVKTPLTAVAIFGGLSLLARTIIRVVTIVTFRTAALARMRDLIMPNQAGTNLIDAEVQAVEKAFRAHVSTREP